MIIENEIEDAAKKAISFDDEEEEK